MCAEMTYVDVHIDMTIYRIAENFQENLGFGGSTRNHKIWGVVSFGTAKACNPRKFSPWKFSSSKVSCYTVPNYLIVRACQNLWLDAHSQLVLVHSLTQSIHEIFRYIFRKKLRAFPCPYVEDYTNLEYRYFFEIAMI